MGEIEGYWSFEDVLTAYDRLLHYLDTATWLRPLPEPRPKSGRP